MRTPTAIKRAPQASGARGPQANAVNRRPKLAFETEIADDILANMESPDDDIEAQSAEVMKLAHKAFDDLEKKQRDNWKENIGLGYFRVLVFDSPSQAAEFMQAIGVDNDEQYLDGRHVADKMGVKLSATDWKPVSAKPNPRLTALAMPLKRRG